MMETSIQNGVALDYHSWKEKENQEQRDQIEVSVTKVLFDESHGELLQSSSNMDNDDETDTWSNLGQVLKGKLNCDVTPHTGEPGSLTSESLIGYTVLVIAAPILPFEPEEVEAIIEFVLDGNSLLIASNYRSFYEQQEKNTLNSLMKPFGFQFKQLLSDPPEEISELYPHYISSEVNLVFVRDPIYLEVLSTKPPEIAYLPHILARLPRTCEPCLAAVETENGRVVAITDSAFLGNEYLGFGDNKQLALNIFRWLAIQNQLDCFDAQVSTEVQYGETATFSISLSNPHDRRIEYISCLLEANPGTEIFEPQEKNLRSLAPYGKTQLQWTIKPIQFGLQKLKLTIDSLQETKLTPLFFDSVAQFTCVPNVEFDFVILNPQGEVPEILETGSTVEVKAVMRPTVDIDCPWIQLKLTSSSSRLQVEPIETSGTSQVWRLTAKEVGDCPITLSLGQTGQRISRLIQIRPSLQSQIALVEKDTIIPLAEEIRRQVSKLHCGLDTDEIQEIPFRLYTPEQYVQVLYSGESEIAEKLLEALRVARHETTENRSLVKLLLQYIAPAYSPVYGCCIPYDPPLATHLVKKHPIYRDYLAQNFLTLEEYDQNYMVQNIAALILHEKYGHGFFFTQTTLGKQLSTLSQHGMDGDAHPSKLKLPYPRLLYEDYQEVIQMLWDSAELLMEGFATWVELTTLPHLSGTVGQAAFRRRYFLFSDAESRYQQGYEYFQFIQDYFGEASGTKAAAKAMIEAADIDIGVVEEGKRVTFALESRRLKEVLFSEFKDDIWADTRLKKIYNNLHSSIWKIQDVHKSLECGQSIDYSDNVIDAIIRESLRS